MNAVMRAWARALAAQFRFKILALSLIPLFISLFLWGGLMAWRLQAIFDFIQAYFSEHQAFAKASDLLYSLGLLALKTLIVPLLSMWLLLPIMIMTSLLFIGLMVMPSIAKHVGNRDFPDLEKRRGASFLSSLGFSFGSFFLFSLVWVVVLPLIFIPPIYMLVQPLLWGWLTYRVMSYDALAAFASPKERQQIVAENRGSLLCIGLVAGWIGSLPSMLWMGGAMSMTYVLLFPMFVSMAIWVYLLIFIFTGLWYQYYCLAALKAMRQSNEIESDVKENVTQLVDLEFTEKR
ncbi:EI24 domain-containing protein [Undibacterium sp. FT137W]|uniref:EI24 domain-containing protein n=1 Tax=Undibacterium fentianense TaxID=2828728 RepID=A0A941E568_9BURK|nr:EI24 domain-containing protein [Undibacterium fentianense]